MLRRATVAAFVVLVCMPASGARRTPHSLLQPTLGDRGRVLSVGDRRATVSAPDGSRRNFRVRRGERWVEFSETSTGWVAAGVRPDRDRLHLSLIADLGRGPRRLSVPSGLQSELATAPRALIGRAGLEGLAWLEGDGFRQLSVKVASFDGSGFGDPVVVSSPGRGSQTGLSAAVLGDGSWLLVWSRFDGNDDEIYWSLRRPSQTWSQPRRLAGNNRTPDVTPHLLPTEEGALVAWSRLDGEYEVVTARFAAGAWTPPRALGVRGTIEPRFRRVTTDDFLLVRNAWPAGWTAFRLDDAGRPTDFAAAAAESPRPPVLRPRPGIGLTFEWAGGRATEPLEWEAVP